MQKRYERIALCPVCKGEGIEIIQPRNRRDDPVKVPCEACQGSGRILRTILINEKPYKPEVL
jgi:DnaJ-class molecular chaperone